MMTLDQVYVAGAYSPAQNVVPIGNDPKPSLGQGIGSPEVAGPRSTALDY